MNPRVRPLCNWSLPTTAPPRSLSARVRSCSGTRAYLGSDESTAARSLGLAPAVSNNDEDAVTTATHLSANLSTRAFVEDHASARWHGSMFRAGHFLTTPTTFAVAVVRCSDAILDYYQ